MGVCMKRSALLASDRTNSSSSRSPLATTRQHVNLDSSAPTDHLVIEIPWALIPWIQNHMKGVIICAILIPLWNLYLLGPLQVCCLKSLVIDIRIYISMDSLNWWCYFFSRRWYVAWCVKIDHLVLTLPHRLLHMLYWWSRIVLVWFAVVSWVCSDEPWTVWTSPLPAGAASWWLVPTWLVP